MSGVATVKDLVSTNGTRVNGKRLARIHVLRHGDQIGVGREQLMYFAELDSATNFMQFKSMKFFAIPAPIRNRLRNGIAPSSSTSHWCRTMPECSTP